MEDVLITDANWLTQKYAEVYSMKDTVVREIVGMSTQQIFLINMYLVIIIATTTAITIKYLIII